MQGGSHPQNKMMIRFYEKEKTGKEKQRTRNKINIIYKSRTPTKKKNNINMQ
uniref:Uncharacterized protein n=1 Tax=Lepeophtheirus salmonis TaxID=72036 RepID=A0A0K2UP58_LEPSM